MSFACTSLSFEVVENRIGLLTLRCPAQHNSLSETLKAELRRLLAELSHDRELGALVITGEGPSFCSGGDLRHLKGSERSADFDRRRLYQLHDWVQPLMNLEMPVIAAVNGPAAGAGFSLALACDFRISAESAFFAPAYGRIGASPDGGMTYFLPRVLGPSRALELLLDDPNLKAPDALEMGLVSEVVPDDQIMDRSRERAAELAKLAPHYVKMAKSLVGTSIDHTLAEHLQLERHGIADGLGTEDARLGVTAFFSGENPEFQGR